MVVTRRQSASPIPAVASRTSSSTGSLRSKGKGVDKSSPLKDSGPRNASPNGTSSNPPPVAPRQVEDIKFDDVRSPGNCSETTPPNSTPSNPPPVGPRQVEDIKFDDDSPSPKYNATPKSKSKSKPRSKKSAKSKKRESNKGISAFDIIARLFLVWLTVYTLSVCPEDAELRSPICHALAEYRRIVLEPYIYPPIRNALDHPAVAPHIQRVQPYYNRLVQVSTPWIRRGGHEWRKKITPRLQWLQFRAQPYILRVERQYYLIIHPYTQQASNALARYRRRAEPYLFAAVLKSQQGWEAAKPYLDPVWREAMRVPGIVTVYVGRPLGQARKQWVDPQVIKIWDAVVEQGKTDAPVVQNTSTKSASSTSTVSTPVYSIMSTPLATSTTPVEDISQTDPTASDSSAIPKPTDEPTASASSITVQSASVINSSEDTALGSSSHQVSFVAPPIEPTNEGTTTSSTIHETETLPPSASEESLVSFDSSPTSSPGAPVTDPYSEDADDLENFLSELDLDSEHTETSEPAAEPSGQPEETEEERLERLRLEEIATAEKRASIESRHTQWEIDLEKFGKAQRKVTRNTLKKLRESASQDARSPGGPVRGPIESLAQEADKSLKSLNAYARKLAAEDKAETEKIKTWEKVVDKVDKRFGEHVDASASSVREWWDAYVGRENYEIALISHEVLTLAEKAQEDIGWDYSWLSDVSYEDWQRYHNLVHTAKDFGELYVGMQNGSAPNAPANPVAEIIEAIQEEVDDMILGFETNLSRIKSGAISSFSKSQGDTLAASISTDPPKEDAETSAAAASKGSDTSPEVSVLPIDPSMATDGALGVPPIILSRGAEEVEAAASRAEQVKSTLAHNEL